MASGRNGNHSRVRRGLGDYPDSFVAVEFEEVLQQLEEERTEQRIVDLRVQIEAGRYGLGDSGVNTPAWPNSNRIYLSLARKRACIRGGASLGNWGSLACAYRRVITVESPVTL